MARDLKINVDGSSDGGQRALEEVAAASAAAAREADRMADQFRQAKRDAAALDRQLAETAVAARAAARELAKNPADAGLKAQLEAQKKAASEIKRLRNDIVGDTEKAAKEASRLAENAAKDLEKLTAGNAGLFSSLKEGFGGGLTSPAGLGLAGVGAVPALATAGGAALAGIGAVGAGAGVAAAVLGDPKAFQTEWTIAAQEVKKEFLSAGDAFVGPTLDAIKTIGPTIDSWHLSQALAPAAKYVPILVDGLERGATGLEHGIADAIKKSGPAVQALSQGFTDLGQAAGDALSHIADGAEGGAQALHDTITAVSAVVEGFGLLTEGAEKAYSAINDHPLIAAGFTAGLSIPASLVAKALGDVDEGGQVVARTLTDTSGAALAAAAAFDRTNASFYGVSVTAGDLALSLAQTGKAFQDASGKALELNDANAAVTLGLKAVKDGFEGGAHSLDVTTVKGAQNVQILDEQVHKLQEARDAAIAAGGGTAQAYEQANSAYNKAIGNLEQTIGKLGAGSKAAHDFFSQFYDRTTRIEIDIIEKHRTTYSDGVLYGSAAGAEEHRYGNKAARGMIRHLAGGGFVPPSNPGTLVVGEPPTRGEAWIPLGGISQQRAMDLAQTVGNSFGFDVARRGARIPAGLFGGGGSGRGVAAVNVVVGGDATDFDRFMATWFMRAQRIGAIQVSAG